MKFIQLDITTRTDGIEPLTALLETVGLQGFVINDSNDFTEFLENRNGWDYIDDGLTGLKNPHCFVTSYIPDDAQAEKILSDVRIMLRELKALAPETYGELKIETGTTDDGDWENNWKQFFAPFAVGENFAVKPSWENLPPELANRKIIQIDPASSFGTGQHASTKLCLEMAEGIDFQGKRSLDLGCGSGILSIAAHLLGAKEIVMTDISENAVNTASENLRLNGCTRFTAFTGDVITSESLRGRIGGGFSVITANIVADVIIEMLPFFGEFIMPGAAIIVSGIISPRKGDVLKEAGNCGYVLSDAKERDGWSACKFVLRD